MIIGRIVLRIGFLDIGCTKTVFRKLDFLGLFICYQGCFRLTSLIFWPCSEFFLGINAFLTNYPGLIHVLVQVLNSTNGRADLNIDMSVVLKKMDYKEQPIDYLAESHLQ